MATRPLVALGASGSTVVLMDISMKKMEGGGGTSDFLILVKCPMNDLNRDELLRQSNWAQNFLGRVDFFYSKNFCGRSSSHQNCRL